MVICVDFDGTLVEHKYPDIGKEVNMAVKVVKELIENGHKIILYTMRSGMELQQAVQWCADHNISLYGINHNPSQSSWTTSPKVYGHLYIDDAALGCPLVYNPGSNKRPYVDWGHVRSLLIGHQILKGDD